MKKYFLLFVAFWATSVLKAQFTENFEPRDGQTTGVRELLASNCWSFPDMLINRSGASPITEAQSMVAGPSSNPTQSTGFITPYLNFLGSDSIAFKYRLRVNIQPGCRRWFRILVIDANNVQTLIDSVEITTGTVLRQYGKKFIQTPGPKRIYVNIRGIGCSSGLVVDDFYATCNKRYVDGCNKAPIVQSDNLTTTINTSVNGNVANNDVEPDNENMTFSIVSQPSNGTLTLSSNGTFSYIPNFGFSGTDQFAYKACDNGALAMCSQTAFANITVAGFRFSESFEPRNGSTTDIRTILRGACWDFPNFSTNGGAVAPITGLQSMVSNRFFPPTADQSIITPYFNFAATEIIEFEYKLNGVLQNNCNRNINIYKMDLFGVRTLMQTLAVTGPNQTQTFSGSFNTPGIFKVVIEVTGSGCLNRVSIDNFRFSGTVNTSSCRPRTSTQTRLQSNLESSANVYPNPAFDQLNINMGNNIAQNVSIYDMQGRTITSNVQTSKVENGVFSINIQHLTPGVYILSITDNASNRIQKRFIKQ